MSTTKHLHDIPGLQAYERAAVVNQLGPTVAGKIPEHPERLEVTINREDEDDLRIALTALKCGCVALIHPAYARSLAQAEQEYLWAIPDLVTMKAVDLAAQKAIDAQIQRELVEEVAEPLRAELEESAANLRELQQETADTFIELLDAVKAHNQQVQEAAEELHRIGARKLLGNSRGRTYTLNLNGTLHEYWSPKDWAAALLQTVHSKHRILGASFRAELPHLPSPGTPRPKIDP